MRTFHLNRRVDDTGVSGTGKIAEGVEFTSGQVAMTWLTPYASTALYPNIRHVEVIHGHDGKTEIVWGDNSERGE